MTERPRPSAKSEAREARATGLSRELALRLVPLLVLTSFLFAVSAPLAFLAMGARELHQDGLATAEQAARTIARDAEELPVLWRYDSLKLVEHLRRFEAQPDVARIEVVDGRGAPIDPSFTPPEADLLWASAPIEVRGQTIGAVWVGSSRTALRQRALALLAGFTLLSLALAALVYVVAMRSAAGAEALILALVERLAARSAEERVRALRIAAIAEQEEDRRAIARDLHDSVGQSLTAIRIQTEVLSTRLSQGEPGHDAAVKLAAGIASATDSTLEEVRRALARLRPAALDEIGLRQAIERLCDDAEEHAGLSVTRHLATLGPLPTTVETTCYRIVQEALTNVARHARDATGVTVTLEESAERVVVLIDDDGPGLDPRAHGTGRGLRGMRERAELLGGSFAIEPLTPHGTRVRAELPVAP